MKPQEPPRRRVPLAVKLVCTAFVALLVPVYLREYGPTNFGYFCDVALLMTVPALWLESPLLASAPLIGIFVPQTVWGVDFLSTLAGHPLTGMTGYMFDGTLSLFTRFLSFFHFWLPLFLLWLVARLGYDRRALVLWSAIAWVLMIVSYTALPPPPAPDGKAWMPVNVNYVYGFRAAGPQMWMPSLQYFLLFATVLQLLIFLPTHLAMAWLMPAASKKSGPAWPGATAVAHEPG